MNSALKLALEEHKIRTREPAYLVAQRAGIHESALSKIIRGIRGITDNQKMAIAEILGKPVSELFPG